MNSAKQMPIASYNAYHSRAIQRTTWAGQSLSASILRLGSGKSAANPFDRDGIWIHDGSSGNSWNHIGGRLEWERMKIGSQIWGSPFNRVIAVKYLEAAICLTSPMSACQVMFENAAANCLLNMTSKVCIVAWMSMKSRHSWQMYMCNPMKWTPSQ